MKIQLFRSYSPFQCPGTILSEYLLNTPECTLHLYLAEVIRDTGEAELRKQQNPDNCLPACEWLPCLLDNSKKKDQYMGIGTINIVNEYKQDAQFSRRTDCVGEEQSLPTMRVSHSKTTLLLPQLVLWNLSYNYFVSLIWKFLSC